MFKKAISACIIAMLFSACSNDTQTNDNQANAQEVNLYSARKEALIKPLLVRFTEETGISVNLITGKADALLKRMQVEGKNSPADLLITTDAGRLHRAKAANLTQAINAEALNQLVPSNYRDSENHWFGLSLRARPIVYVKDKVDPSTLSTYQALAGDEWKQRICIRSSDNIYNQSLVAAFIAHDGEAKTEAWAKNFVNNFARAPKGGDRDQVKAAAAGQCDVAVVNTYYLAAMLSSKDAAEKAAAEKVAVFWPNQAAEGTHVNISGAAVMAAAPHKENAVKLLTFLANDASQAWYAEANGEYPIRDGIAISKQLKSWGTFKKDTLNLDQLGQFNSQAVKLMDRAGWK